MSFGAVEVAEEVNGTGLTGSSGSGRSRLEGLDTGSSGSGHSRLESPVGLGS